uniref:Uncharacterized protein n=1 Tax=Anopheles dirus TaxID=7168 RepID=A0A182NHC2_9DIPT
MSEASLRANSCVELSEIRRLDSLLRQCETLSYDDLSSGSNGERELEDYMEQKKHVRRRRNSSGTCIFTPPINKSTLSMLSSLNFLSSARKLMGAVNGPMGGLKPGGIAPDRPGHPDESWLLSQKPLTTKSCSNLPKGLNFQPSAAVDGSLLGDPIRHQQQHQPVDNCYSRSETILPSACRCATAARRNAPPPNTLQIPNVGGELGGCLSWVEDGPRSTAGCRKHQCPTMPDEDNRIVNIIETPNIVPISMKSLNSALSERLCSTARAQRSFDNKSDKSLLSQANSVKSRSKFSPLSRKISHKTNSFDTEPAEGAKESLLGHKFEKILPEPVETP